MDEKLKGNAAHAEDIAAVAELGQSLSPEEDRRILRKLDKW